MSSRQNTVKHRNTKPLKQLGKANRRARAHFPRSEFWLMADKIDRDEQARREEAEFRRHRAR